MRVYQLARVYGKKSKEIIDLLKQYGVEVKNHMSNLDDRAQFLIREWFAEHEQERVPQQEETAGEPKQEIEVKQEEPKKEKAHVEAAEAKEPSSPQRAEKVSVYEVEDPVPVRKLAELTEQTAGAVIKELMQMGIMATINQAVDLEIARKIAEKHNVLLEEKKVEKREQEIWQREAKDLSPRPPVIAVLGHVDHGKTLLLDRIRQTRVAEREHGGITQHIGASSVEKAGRKLIFLDTPGHEAFTALRARGARVTDLVVLVVAADDGVKPQTIEAINHARAAKVPIVVAINKMDKEGANADIVKRQLSEQDLIPEDWGGETIMVPVSAKTGEGMDELLEMIILQADLLELKASPTGPAIGTVIELRRDRNRGPVCTVLVQQGEIKIGDPVVVGAVSGKVRNMWNDRGEQLKKADPQNPVVELMGLSGLPMAGDILRVVASEKEGRELAAKTAEKRKAQAGARRMTLEKVSDLMEAGKFKELKLICKGDTQGSLEGLVQAISSLSQENIRLRIIHQAAGDITESDVMLASASEAVILGFCVKCPNAVLKLAEREGVQVRLYKIIYEAVDEVQKSIQGMLEEKVEEVKLGIAEVKALFSVPRLKKVAGCVVKEGVAQRGAKFRLLRNGERLGPFSLDSLKRFREDVKEVAAGKECGIGSFDFKDFAVGDELEVFIERKV